ncbi:MAG: adenine deaminase [Syntrophales bacterium]|nr:adenine deaminase [Syntrophales bacterium]MDD5643789.1 adenine deaminase [Syntrophales bacterium]
MQNISKWQKRLQAARGEIPADLVLTGARVAGVYSGEWLKKDVAVFDGVIVGLGDYSGPRIDISGRYLLPGLIDGHLHVESSMLTLRELAQALLPLGTTTVVSDPHEIANVNGPAGLDYLLAASEGLPLDFFFMLPSCVPATSLETSGARLEAPDLKPYLGHPRVLGLAEVMNFPGVVAGDPGLLEKIALFPRRPVDGHAPLLSGKALNAYRLAGIGSDHECTQLAEAKEKLEMGFYIMLREGSLAKNLADLLPVVTPASLRRTMLVTDDSHPGDLVQNGHLDHLLRLAVARGLDPLAAVTMATLNPASYFGFRDRGALSPGLAADLVVVEDLASFKVDKVLKNGRLVVDRGRMASGLELPSPPPPPPAMQVKMPDIDSFSPPVAGDAVKVIGLIPGQLLTEKLVLPPPVKDGRLAADPAQDLLKLAVVERHRGTGNLGLALVRGFGLKQGALASSVAHDSHNIVVVGAAEADMLLAVEHLVKLQGGLAVVAGGRVLADLPLPIAGLISPKPLKAVAGAYAHLMAAYRQLGGVLDDPFMALSFLALPVIPALKLTDLGLVDVNKFQVVPLFGED